MGLHLVTGYAGDEHISAADFGSLQAAILGSGEFVLDRGSKLSAQVISNNKIRIADGDVLMQGRHIRLNPSGYEEVTIENGGQEVNRHDLIVIAYSKNSITGVETAEFKVLKGTPTAETPTDPTVIVGNIIGEESIYSEMALYRVPLTGLNIGNLEPLFTVQVLCQSQIDDLKDGTITAGNADKLDGKHATEFATSAQGTKADNAVPNARKINGKALTADIVLAAIDVGAMTGKVLWTNKSPTSDFPAQSVAVNSTGYKAVMVTQYAHKSATSWCGGAEIVVKGGRSNGFLFAAQTNGILSGVRTFQVNDTSVYFNAAGNTNGQAFNDGLIPYQIIGLNW